MKLQQILLDSSALLRWDFLISLACPSIINYSSHSYPCTLPWFDFSWISPPPLASHFMWHEALILSCCWIGLGVAHLASHILECTTQSKEFSALVSFSPFFLVSIASKGLHGQGGWWGCVFLLTVFGSQSWDCVFENRKRKEKKKSVLILTLINTEL